MTVKAFRVALACMWLTAVTVAAQPRVDTLADFNVQQLDGETVSSDAIARTEHWAIVYVEPHCVSCEETLTFWRGEHADAAAARTVVIVGRSSLDAARALAARTPHLANAAWYVDHGTGAGRALGANGAPVVFGLRDRSIVWATRGALPTLRTVVLDWLNR